MSSDPHDSDPMSDVYGQEDLSDNPVMMQQAEDRQREMERFYRRRRMRTILSIVIAISLAAVAAAVCYHVFGPDAIIAFLEECWPVFVAPFIGWFLGKWAVDSLYRPSGKMVLSLDPDTHMIRGVFIPDQMFRYFEQSGNNVLYHSMLGMPVYLAESIDTESGIIEYSWIHELGSMEVMTREETYRNWRGTLEQVLRDNLELMDHPHVIGLGYARKCLKDHLDMIAETLGLIDRDSERGGIASHQESEDISTGGLQDERGNRLHQADGARPDHRGRKREAREVM